MNFNNKLTIEIQYVQNIMMENPYCIFRTQKYDVLYHLTKFETKTRFVHQETKKRFFLRCKVDQVK